MELTIVIGLVEMMLTLLALCGVFIASFLLYTIVASIVCNLFKRGKK